MGQTTDSDQIQAELTEAVAETLLRREDLQLTLICVSINKRISKVKVSRNRPSWPKGFWVGYGPGFS